MNTTTNVHLKEGDEIQITRQRAVLDGREYFTIHLGPHRDLVLFVDPPDIIRLQVAIENAIIDHKDDEEMLDELEREHA